MKNLWLLVLLAAVGCFDLPDFAQSSMIDRPRILAVVADPPEISPTRSDSTTLSILVAGAKEVSDVRWLACGMPSSFGTGNQYGENDGDSGCGNRAIVLGEGERIEVPLEQARAFLNSDELARAALGAQLPAAVLEQVRTSIGIAATVQVEIKADNKHLRALKRVLVREQDHPGTNPPPPSFRFGDTIVRSLGAQAPYRCAPGEGQLHAKRGETVSLSPVFDGDVEPWLEEYNVMDARGVIDQRMEQAFYSWFTDQGALDDDMTRAPNRNNSWRAPDKSGCAHLWLVVRDGHAGATACSTQVAVGEAACSDDNF
ncbi:MAG TPA: hypothetical protein VFN67_38435 [Polyangiales bacterium]|nr:hypothetical protein [Polyangiales bacterium]